MLASVSGAISVPGDPQSRRRTTGLVVASLALVLASVAAPWSQRADRSAKGVSWDEQSPSPPHAVLPARLDPGLPTSGHRELSVIVQAAEGQLAQAESAVRMVRGRVGPMLSIINGFDARVAADELVRLATAGHIVAITANRSGRFQTASYDGVATASTFVPSSGATKAWSNGDYGQGIGVALIDTGVSPMHDLSSVVYGPDLSGEGSVVDTYGHGTVMAGIIEGSGSDSASGSDGAYTGIAPRATVVAVKVAGANGAVDVSTVLQAMSWVSAYAGQFNIRVVNLSYGVPSTQDPGVDPLDYAVERLWRQGMVVVVAAGNGGPNSTTIAKPGDDPLAITVGAYDDSTGRIPMWSSRGPTAQGVVKPDLVAPGRTIVATRSFGSTVEQNNPSALIAPSYIKGSGTSEATAVTSGAVALLLEARPTLTPDQVKGILKATASQIQGAAPDDQGAGKLQLTGALNTSAGTALIQAPQATGLGSINASRGGMYVSAVCAGATVVINGEEDVRCNPWNGASWTGASWTGASWTGASWTGASWTGGSWTGGSWTGGSWTGASWTGASWTGGSWTDASWQGSDWETGQFDASSWTGASWTGASWTGASWTGGSWTGGSWTTYDPFFMTAWWGDHPTRHVPGELVVPPTHGPPFS